MRKARRTVAAALVMGASALALTACFPLPPALPSAPPVPGPDPAPSPSTATPTTAPSGPTEPTASTAPAGDLPYTVDDEAGDTWSFAVAEVIADPPMQSGAAAAGTHLVGVVIDAQHVEGSASFGTCFEIFVKGDDGQQYSWRDTIEITAENDIYFADRTAFTGAVAAVQLPEGVEPAQVIMRSAYGYPEVADTVIDVAR